MVVRVLAKRRASSRLNWSDHFWSSSAIFVSVKLLSADFLAFEDNEDFFGIPLWRRRLFYLFIYLGFYVAFNTVQVISRRVVGSAEETSTYS